MLESSSTAAEQQKNTDSEFRFLEGYKKNPIYSGCGLASV